MNLIKKETRDNVLVVDIISPTTKQINEYYKNTGEVFKCLLFFNGNKERKYSIVYVYNRKP